MPITDDSKLNRLRYYISKDDLKILYLDRKLSQKKVAKELGVSEQVIRDRLKYYNIPIRNANDASKVKASFKRKWIYRVMVFCEYCDKEILQKPYVLKQKYCSHHCSNKSNECKIHNSRKMLTKVMSFCKNCDNEILHNNSRCKSFCCRDCEFEYYKLNPYFYIV